MLCQLGRRVYFARVCIIGPGGSGGLRIELDSSALVKRYVHEQRSVWVRETAASVSGHLIQISILTVAEIARVAPPLTVVTRTNA